MTRQMIQHLQPTGYNSDFNYQNFSFSAYCIQLRDIITAHHTHQTQFNLAKIVEANSPYDWPSASAKSGVVLVHGLTDSAFQLRDMGLFLQQQGFWVRAITLPGHGTVPGDLLTVKLAAWQQAVAYAVNDLAQQVEKIYICGYSMGGALAVDLAMSMPTLAGLILLAPALHLKRYIEVAVRSQMFVKTLWKRAAWLDISPEIDYAKYMSLATNGAFQLQLLIDRLRENMQKLKQTVPTFMVLTEQDELLDNEKIIQSYQQFPHPNNQLLFYTAKPAENKPDIVYRNSCYPAQNIINFSHVALAAAPDNSHYGMHGDLFTPLNGANIIAKGSLTPFNLQQRKVQRLTYNPDFQGMTELLATWLLTI